LVGAIPKACYHCVVTNDWPWEEQDNQSSDLVGLERSGFGLRSTLVQNRFRLSVFLY